MFLLQIVYAWCIEKETYFPTVKELVSPFTRGGLPVEGLSEKPAQQTVDELAMEKSGHFGNLNKSTLGGNMGGRVLAQVREAKRHECRRRRR